MLPPIQDEILLQIIFHPPMTGASKTSGYFLLHTIPNDTLTSLEDYVDSARLPALSTPRDRGKLCLNLCRSPNIRHIQGRIDGSS